LTCPASNGGGASRDNKFEGSDKEGDSNGDTVMEDLRSSVDLRAALRLKRMNGKLQPIGEAANEAGEATATGEGGAKRRKQAKGAWH